MRLPPLVPALFQERLNRFAGRVLVEGSPVLVHIANSGRMKELLQEGRTCWLVERHATKRKTAYDLALVDLGHTLASADARLPSALVAEGVMEGGLEEFRGWRIRGREVPLGHSRLDLVLEQDGRLCWVEAKSVTLVERGVGLFPDAPTTRGQRHMESLAEAVRQGHRAAVVFVVQRSDACAFAPNDLADPAFGEALRAAQAQGVEVYAYRCRVGWEEVCLDAPLPVFSTLSQARTRWKRNE
ncbi:MAG: DNA/RNA nuclease SfsA [Dehalococcoidia bacterium]